MEDQILAIHAQVQETIARNRARFGDARMEGPDDPPAPKPDEPAPKPDDKPAEKLLPQSEVNRIAATEKEAGKRAAEQELANRLGVPLDEAEQILKAHRERQDAAKTEAEKAKEAAEAEKREAEAEKQAAKAEVHETRLERAFAKTGLALDDDEKLARIRRMVTVEVGASYDDVLADVTKLKESFPELFEAKADDGKGKQKQQRKAPSGDPSGQPPKPAAGEDAFARGRERAKSHGSGFRSRVEKS